MKLITKTIETTGLVSHSKCLLLDESLPIAQDSRVRVIILVTTDAEPNQRATVALPSPEEYVDKLAGLHQAVWPGIDIKTYINQERDSWE